MVLLLLLLLPLRGGKDKNSPLPLLVERGDDDLSWLPHSLLILPASAETRVETIVFFPATFLSAPTFQCCGSGSGSIGQRGGDPDPYKNVTDPQHWKFLFFIVKHGSGSGSTTLELSVFIVK
jgi:hypothetical protein